MNAPWRAVALVATILATSPAAGQGTQPGQSVQVRQSAADTTLLRAPVRLCAGGDVTLGTNLDAAWAKEARTKLFATYGLSDSPDSLIVPVRPLFATADIVLVNVEGAIGAGSVASSKCGPKSKNCFAFRQPPAAADAVRSLGSPTAVVVGNVANNHSHDAGTSGFIRTRELLTNAGVLVTGADTLATAVPTPAGDTIGVLGFHTSSEVPDARDLAAVRRHVQRAVQQFKTVIVTMHLGAEGPAAQRTRDAPEVYVKEQRGNPVAFANAALAAGATMVIGHGPHVVRAAEWRDSTLVMYSLGNLITYGPFGLGPPANTGVVVCATIAGPGRVTSASIAGTIQRAPGVFSPDSTGRSLTLIDSLSGLDFPHTGVRVDSGGVLARRDSTPR